MSDSRDNASTHIATVVVATSTIRVGFLIVFACDRWSFFLDTQLEDGDTAKLVDLIQISHEFVLRS